MTSNLNWKLKNKKRTLYYKKQDSYLEPEDHERTLLASKLLYKMDYIKGDKRGNKLQNEKRTLQASKCLV